MRDRCLFAVLALSIPMTATVYEVGPGKRFAAIGEVPWAALNPGDRVDIYWRSTAYKERWCINRSGTTTAPIVIRGIPNSLGALPVIDADGAVTAATQYCWNEDRAAIKIGGGSGEEIPRNIVIEQLEIKNAKAGITFKPSQGGTGFYIYNASGIFVERGYGITIRRCQIHDNGNGIFVASGSAYQARDIMIERNHLYDNGYFDGDQQHNTYTSAINIIYQFNRMTMFGRGGNNLKDRSANAIYRYNWIEAGNRQLDLVDAHPAISSAPGYHDSYAYGNVLIDHVGYDNAQLVNFGGDSADRTLWRQGTLYFFNNTVVSYRYDEPQLVRIGHVNGRADVRNNIVYTPNGTLHMLSDAGTIDLQNNWLKTGWKVKGLASSPAVVNDLGGNITGTNPGFVNAVATAAADYRLLSTSPCLDRAGANNPLLPASFGAVKEYVPITYGRGRLKNGLPDLGAFEYLPPVPAPRINTLTSKPL